MKFVQSQKAEFLFECDVCMMRVYDTHDRTLPDTLVARFSRIRVLRRRRLCRRVYTGFSGIRTSSCQCGGKVSRRAPSFGFRFSRRGFLKCKFKVASTDGANFTASGSVWHLAVTLYMHITSRTRNFLSCPALIMRRYFNHRLSINYAAM